jgi:hypothetical protein
MKAINRPCSAANLDPANDNITYDAAFDVRDLVSVEDVMEREELGPNGGVLWAMEELEANFDWLEEHLDECGMLDCEQMTMQVLIRCRGDDSARPTRTTGAYHTSHGPPADIAKIRKAGLSCMLKYDSTQLAPLTDSAVDCRCSTTRFSCFDSAKSLFEQLTALFEGHASSTIPSRFVYGGVVLHFIVLTLIVNVLTKIDNLKAVGGDELPFNLEFYTEVQDLQQLLPVLSAEQADSAGGSAKWEALNTALIGLIEDFGLVGFETLAVEDRQSMASLLRAIDRASGYVFAGARATDEEGRTLDDEASIWAQAMSEQWAGRMDVRDVQERWIDRKEEFDELERQGWEEEARLAGALPESGAATALRKDADGDAKMDDDELLAEQAKWEAENAKSGDGGPKVVRKA